MSLSKADCSEPHLLPRWPPWACLPRLLYLDEGRLLVPSSEQVMWIFVSSVRSPRFALLSTDHKRVIDLETGSLPVSINENNTNMFTMHLVLVRASLSLKSYEHVEIVSSASDLFSFLRLGKRPSGLQLKCLESMVTIRDNISLCVYKIPCTSYGLRLSWGSCESTDIYSLSLYSLKSSRIWDSSNKRGCGCYSNSSHTFSSGTWMVKWKKMPYSLGFFPNGEGCPHALPHSA